MPKKWLVLSDEQIEHRMAVITRAIEQPVGGEALFRESRCVCLLIYP